MIIGKTHLGRKRFKVHFVGIGGIGMSGIAEVLLNLGYEISGSDLKETEITKRLRSLGAKVACGQHRKENVKHVDVVVVSSAIRTDNPEVLEAKARSIPVIPRGEMLSELVRLKESIAITGSHGKTTTTSLIASIMESAGWSPTVVVGGKLNALGRGASVGTGDWIVVEADESDGSFLKLSPSVAVITNIDPEHLDHYHSYENLKKACIEFACKVPFYSFSMLCLDNPGCQSIIPQITKKLITYGFSVQADYRAENLAFFPRWTEFDFIARGQTQGRVKVKLLGAHNVLNTIASMAVGVELSIPMSDVVAGVESFSGVNRRFTIVGERSGALLVDDYAHHPVEIVSTLEAAKSAFPSKRIIAIFQPHRYTRVKILCSEFKKSFNRASEVIVTEIYPAGEDPIEGVSGKMLAEGIKNHGHKNVKFIPRLPEIVDYLRKNIKSNDLVISLGAGDVVTVLKQLLKE